MRYIAYTRVSTSDQEENGASLAAQEAAIRAECDRRQWQLDRVESDSLSGKSMRRDGLERALDSCRNGDTAGLVVAKLDRLTRSVIDLGAILEDAKKHGWNLVALDFGLDMATPQGELVANVLMSVAQWERRIIGERTREAMRYRKTQGLPVGPPSNFPPVLRRRVKKWRAEGWSYRDIARKLNAENIPTPRGGSEWRPSSLQAALRD